MNALQWLFLATVGCAGTAILAGLAVALLVDAALCLRQLLAWRADGVLTRGHTVPTEPGARPVHGERPATSRRIWFLDYHGVPVVVRGRIPHGSAMPLVRVWFRRADPARTAIVEPRLSRLVADVLTAAVYVGLTAAWISWVMSW